MSSDTPFKLAAVGCSGSKYDDACLLPAAERYKGSYWVHKQRYGETCATAWKIISAKYGVLDPEQPIEDYDKTPDDLADVQVDSDAQLPDGTAVTTKLDLWALDVYHGLVEWVESISRPDERKIELEVLLGRSYRDPLEQRGVFDALEARDEQITVTFPFQEEPEAQGGMFQQIGWMSSEIDGAAPSK